MKQVRKTAMREIRVLKELRHSNIVNLIEVFRWRHKICLVFEYVPKTILEELEENPQGFHPMQAGRRKFNNLRSGSICGRCSRQPSSFTLTM